MKISSLNRKLLRYTSVFVISTVTTLSFYTILFNFNLKNIKLSCFIFFVASNIFSFFVLRELHDKYESIVKKSKEGKKHWSVSLMGPTRAFEELKFDIMDKRYKSEVDLFYLLISSIVFLLIFLTILTLKKSFGYTQLLVKKEIFPIVFGLTFTYAFFLGIYYLYIYEKHIAVKRGRINVGDDTLYAIIFFSAIDLSFLLKFIYDFINLIFFK